MVTVIEKKHKNARGEWAACSATQRKCRYAANEHKFVKTEVPEPELIVKKNVATVTVDDDSSVDESDNVTYRIAPNRRGEFERNIEKANRKLERAGIEERFTVDFEETVAVHPDTGIEYVVLKATLNRPVISSGDWTFAGKVDYFLNEKGEQVISLRGFNGVNLTSEYETTDAVRCDYCGHRRARNKTFVVKNSSGEYKQVGSNCLQAFLGVRPKGLWALEDDIVDEERFRNGGQGLTWDPQFMLINTKNVIALGLALSEGGKKYGASSHSDSTKSGVVKYLMGTYDTKVDVDAYADLADKMMKETVFDTTTDYGRNMKVLLEQENTTFRKIGYVVSIIPAYLKQQGVKNRPAKAKGYIGNVGEKVTEIRDCVVEKVVSIPNNFSYYGGSNLMIVFRTPDNKLIKWVTGSRDERLESFDKGTRVTLNTVTIKDYDEWNDEDQTTVKNVKFDLVEQNN